LGVLLGALRRERRTGDDTRVLDLADALGDELGLDGLGVDLLHAGGGLVGLELGDLREQRLRILVARPQALEVEAADAAELADLDGRGRADDSVHGRRHQGEAELVGVDLPGDVDVLGVAGATARNDGDVVEPIRPAPRLADADLELSHNTPFLSQKKMILPPASSTPNHARGSPRRTRRNCLATAEIIS